MKTNKQNNRKIKSTLRFLLLGVLLFSFSQCRMDDDGNYRILIENNCDFALKVYYDNQDIEYYEDGWGDRWVDDIDVTGAVTFIPPYGSKTIHSKYTYVWVEPDVNYLRSRRFRGYNDDAWRKVIDVFEQDFDER